MQNTNCFPPSDVNGKAVVVVIEDAEGIREDIGGVPLRKIRYICLSI